MVVLMSLLMDHLILMVVHGCVGPLVFDGVSSACIEVAIEVVELGSHHVSGHRDLLALRRRLVVMMLV